MSNSLKASYGKGSSNKFKKKNHFKLGDNPVIFRIIGPIAKFTDDARGWIKHHSVHFGYKNTEGKFRIFESPEVKDFETQEVQVKDAALERLEQLKTRLEKAKLEGNTPMVTELNKLVGFRGTYSLDKNYHMNVIALDGSIGELKIRHKAKQKLEREINKLLARDIDPLSDDNGRFFVFTREGTGNTTDFDVSVYTKTGLLPDGRSVSEDVVHVITPDMWNKIHEEAFDLNDLFEKPTAEEVQQIVAESDLRTGNSPACDRIFDERWKASRAQNASSEDKHEPVQAAPVAVQTVVKPVVAPVVIAASAPAVVTPAPVAPVLTANPVSHAAPVVAQPVAAKTQAQAIDQMSDADFFANLGVQTQ